MGLDVSIRYQLTPWLFFNTDANYAHARLVEEPSGKDYIPLAPRISAGGGLSVKHPSGWSGGVQYRYLGDRPANEDNSLSAEGYFITDMNVNYKWGNWSAGVVLENIFNNQWKEAQFGSASQLRNESNPVEDIHFISGTPVNIRGVVKMKF
jgi:outer membrane receptor protein involved in Fe transport